jgi:hypothetical protein
MFGISGGAGKVDKGCDDRETARSFALLGNREAAAIILCNTPASKRAHLTLEQCMNVTVRVQQPILPPIVLPQPAPIINVPVTVVPVEVPTPVTLPVQTSEATSKEFGSCRLVHMNACLRLVDDAMLYLQSHPEASLVLRGPQEGSKILVYTRSRHLASSRIRMEFSDEQNDTLTVSVFSVW